MEIHHHDLRNYIYVPLKSSVSFCPVASIPGSLEGQNSLLYKIGLGPLKHSPKTLKMNKFQNWKWFLKNVLWGQYGPNRSWVVVEHCL